MLQCRVLPKARRRNVTSSVGATPWRGGDISAAAARRQTPATNKELVEEMREEVVEAAVQEVVEDIDRVGLVLEVVEEVRQEVRQEVVEVVRKMREEVVGRCWRSIRISNGRLQRKTTSQMTTFLLTFLVCPSRPPVDPTPPAIRANGTPAH